MAAIFDVHVWDYQLYCMWWFNCVCCLWNHGYILVVEQFWHVINQYMISGSRNLRSIFKAKGQSSSNSLWLNKINTAFVYFEKCTKFRSMAHNIRTKLVHSTFPPPPPLFLRGGGIPMARSPMNHCSSKLIHADILLRHPSIIAVLHIAVPLY